ncbi:serine threonine- phosphatase 2A regulatory subunit B subunit alpha-like protein [Labeo rohita]|uniref:Serine threonine-phosphatase 2A regulatory subunit B subunit alpha-like protein n=1 Tax=Labeo rohita TaxID=84645 RepID=A0A498P2T6_LABRO|nr:serine threonine- phosphatase 2A regulatory subunit B subunit alpha-like protein [Labeo rohita]
MAATYRIVVSSINCYNSVVIDRRVQHTVHYCNGPCGALKHGLNCTVAHRSTCAELLDTPISRTCSDRPISIHESKTMENGNTGPGAFCDDYHQVVPRVKKGSAIQSSASLKDITGEAINLASGKIKEFSFEKIKYSSSHVTFRKGRKVRPDSFSRRSTDLDIIYGQFTGNDENCPPFGLFQKSVLEEHKLSRSASLEQNLNSVATLYLNSLTEENLITRILEKTKADSSASGEDIKACLDILLKCSEDLKKCTDIIKQCIKRKSMGGSNDDSGNPEVIYKNVMARLSNYLKRLPLELEQGQGVRQEHSELAELVNSIHGLQQIPFSPIFGNEQPPRYEDVVQSPPPTKPRAKPSQPEPPEGSRDHAVNLKPIQSPTGLSARTPPSTNGFPHGNLPSASSSTSTPYICHHTVSTSRPDTFSSTNSLLSSSSESICKDAMEALYIEEEDSDVGRMPDRAVKGDGKHSCSISESRPFSKRTTGYSEPGGGVSDKLHELSRNGTVFKPKNDSTINQMYLPKSTDSRLYSRSTSHVNKGGADDIDKLLMDLECLSQNMQKEPPLPPKLKNCAQQTGSPQHLIGNSVAKDLPVPGLSGPSVTKPSETGVEATEEDDGALLLRILESIESFAQELVESGAGRGTQSKEREVMRLLQDTLASTKAEVAPLPLPVPPTETVFAPAQTPKCIPAPTPSSATAAVQTPASTVRDTGSTLLIQQTPEVIREASLREDPDLRGELAFLARGCDFVLPSRFKKRLKSFQQAQIQPEKKPGTPPPTLAPAPSSPTPRPPSPPPAKVVATPPPSSINIPRFYFPKGLPNCAANYDEAIAKIEAAFTEFEEEKADIYEMGKIAKDIVDTHPGLTFLKDAPEFHSRYITTTLALLEEEDDINQITDYFSYEHFYVIYCKFWELDTDHDLFIDPKDLARYNDHASSSRIIERLFSGAVTRGNSVQREGRMSYAEFVWFLISEEDKKNPTSIEYWFRCMDMDGDGVLSMFELEFFYEEQCERMEGMGIEPLPFQDLLCQMLDLVKPECPGKITLRDLKRCRMAHIFYDTFFNLEKYLDHEQRDPFAVQKDLDSDGPEPSDWDKYAAEEYEILVAEETANEQLREGSFDDDYESDELTVSSDIGNKMDKLVISDLSA